MIRQRLTKPLLAAGVLALLMISASVAEACGRCGRSCCVTYQTVERTVCVPTMVPEKRMVCTVEYDTEVREREVVVHRCVPETQQVVETCTVMVPQQKVRTERYMVCRPVWDEVQQPYTVCVPHHEKRKGVRNVCRPVTVEEMRTVCRDEGHWEEVACEGCYVKCCGLLRCKCAVVAYCGTQMVWVSNIVKEEVPVQVCRYETAQEEYEYTVTSYTTETRTRPVKVCRYVQEEKERQVPYTVCVPEKREFVRNVTTYRTVAEKKMQKYTVCVPRQVQREVTVNVCQMVPKTVTCCVPVCSCCSCCCH